jgi:hypothetical protein
MSSPCCSWADSPTEYLQVQSFYHDICQAKRAWLTFVFRETKGLKVYPFHRQLWKRYVSQCQAFQQLVKSSHTLADWILNNSLSTESIFNQFSVLLKTLNALCVCLKYKHPRSIKRVIRSDKSITSVFPVKSQKCDFGAEHRCRLFATSAGKGLKPMCGTVVMVSLFVF